MGDFDGKITEYCKECFCESYGLNPLKKSTCYKNLKISSCIDVIRTGSPLQFKTSAQ